MFSKLLWYFPFLPQKHSVVSRGQSLMKQNLSVFEFCEWATEQLVSKKTPRSQSWFLFYFFSFTRHLQRPTSPWVEQRARPGLALSPALKRRYFQVSLKRTMDIFGSTNVKHQAPGSIRSWRCPTAEGLELTQTIL